MIFYQSTLSYPLHINQWCKFVLKWMFRIVNMDNEHLVLFQFDAYLIVIIT